MNLGLDVSTHHYVALYLTIVSQMTMPGMFTTPSSFPFNSNEFVHFEKVIYFLGAEQGLLTIETHLCCQYISSASVFSYFGSTLVTAVQNGTVPHSRVDVSVLCNCPPRIVLFSKSRTWLPEFLLPGERSFVI